MSVEASTVILVPHTAYGVEPECARALDRLEERGFTVRREVHGPIDFARSLMASKAIADGFEHLMWIDSDVEFNPEDVAKLVAHELPVVSGIYPKKGARAIASNLLPTTQRVVFGNGGGVIEIAYAAAGFLCAHRSVYEAIAAKLPLCNESFGSPFTPFFMPMIGEKEGKPWYLGEDFAFSERVRQAGFKVHADTSIRLRHFGRYGYGWEDAGSPLQRFASYTFHVADAQPPG